MVRNFWSCSRAFMSKSSKCKHESWHVQHLSLLKKCKTMQIWTDISKHDDQQQLSRTLTKAEKFLTTNNTFVENTNQISGLKTNFLHEYWTRNWSQNYRSTQQVHKVNGVVIKNKRPMHGANLILTGTAVRRKASKTTNLTVHSRPQNTTALWLKTNYTAPW